VHLIIEHPPPVPRRYEHTSATLGCTMKFSVIDPSAGSGAKMPVIYWLSGLTCTDRNFIEKAGAFGAAAKHGVLIVCPDTSPRGVDIEVAMSLCLPLCLSACLSIQLTIHPDLRPPGRQRRL
jgi:hypothetical protein